MREHRESPTRRVNPSGKVVYVARYTRPDGRRVSAGTFPLRRLAQDAIDHAYERPQLPDTMGAYAATWTERRPRSERTNRTNDHRLSRVLDAAVEGRPLRDWPLAELRRRHAVALVDHMLRAQGRATTGAAGILSVLSALAEDAIEDDLMGANPFKGVKVNAKDPRAKKAPRKPVVYGWEPMHAFAAAAATVRTGKHEPSELDAWRAVFAEAMIRVLSDCGLRLGELLALERRDFDDGALRLRGSAHEGSFAEGDTRTKRHVRTVPVPPALAAMLSGVPRRIDTPLMFPTPTGRLWRESLFYRDVWRPTKALVDSEGALLLPDMQAATPHAFRHSWESHLHAARIDQADLAAMAGHTVATMTGRYVHALGRSFEAVKMAIGGAP